MNETLPLFDLASLQAPQSPLQRERENPTPRAAGGGSQRASPEERHLRAAWRLSRGMWRYPDHSPEQARAGRAICHHLRALLAESSDRQR
jgi:hypothetical protein